MYYFKRGNSSLGLSMVSQLYQKVGTSNRLKGFDPVFGNIMDTSSIINIIDLPIDINSLRLSSMYYSDMSCRKKALLGIVSKGIITTNKVWEF